MLSHLKSLLLLLATLYTIGVAVFLFKQILYARSNTTIFYYPSSHKHIQPLLQKIIKKYLNNQTKKYNLVEPGSGLAHTSVYLTKLYNWKKIYAVEGQGVVCELAKLYKFFHRQPIEILHKDIFNFTFPEKNFVYCYLGNKIMDRLYREEKLKGNLIISLTFPIAGIEPTEVFKLPNFQKNLFVYDFRE